MRFFWALIQAIANLAKPGLTALWNFGDAAWRTACSFIPFGGGSGTVMPPKKLDLPDINEAHEVKDVAQDQQIAADLMLSSPARVVQAWARASKSERDTIPLTKLSTDQIDWLEVRLSDDQIKILAAEKSEFKIEAALNGQEGAVFGVPSVPTVRKKSGPNLSDRIAEFRMNGIERPPVYALN